MFMSVMELTFEGSKRLCEVIGRLGADDNTL